MLVRKENRIIKKENRITKSNKRLTKEGASAGVLITMHDLIGDVERVVSKKDMVDVYLKNVSLDNCAIHTYYWSTDNDDLSNGKAVLTFDLSSYPDDGSVKDFVEDIKSSGSISLGSCTLTHGGGWSHSSLDGEITCEAYDGIHTDWHRLYPLTYLWDDVIVSEVKLDFGSTLEYMYQDGYDNYMDDEN